MARPNYVFRIIDKHMGEGLKHPRLRLSVTVTPIYNTLLHFLKL